MGGAEAMEVREGAREGSSCLGGYMARGGGGAGGALTDCDGKACANATGRSVGRSMMDFRVSKREEAIREARRIIVIWKSIILLVDCTCKGEGGDGREANQE